VEEIPCARSSVFGEFIATGTSLVLHVVMNSNTPPFFQTPQFLYSPRSANLPSGKWILSILVWCIAFQPPLLERRISDVVKGAKLFACFASPLFSFSCILALFAIPRIGFSARGFCTPHFSAPSGTPTNSFGLWQNN
jgi:hypothetical protein